MKQTLTSQDMIALLGKNADDLTAAAEQLRELDAAIGDGDLGITVTIGFGAVREALEDLVDSDLATIVMRSGMAFNRKAASTFGALYATMMMRAAREAKGKDEVGPEDLLAMLEAAVQGVRDRGKAQVGDKTMLDALVPAAEAMRGAVDGGASLADAVSAAAAAAEQGAQATVELKSKIGRASWFSDRTQGVRDPGATAIALLLKSLSEFVSGEG